MTEDSEYRIRLVTLGSGGVGKSSIVKRFLFNTYSDRYKPTVEDLFCKEFDLESMTLKVDILDTAGDHQFPAMRRLSIANGHAFLLVYSIDSIASFELVKQCFQEVREHKPDYQEVPIIVAGNKIDLPADRRQVGKEDVAEWLFCDLPRLRAKFVECSAKENTNIRELFRGYLQLARIPQHPGSEAAPHHLAHATVAATAAAGLQRRCSARVSGPRARGLASFSSSLQASPSSAVPDRSPEVQAAAKAKPRSRSLIRRTSKKASKLKEHGVDDCTVS
ncbi:GTP-binding protein Di-Ras2 [Dermacentor albipictus]|uniref:GTP-binding protein Di-Ras2 n=1 Tax=Dermacentor albipictus TaxID=60249 RepID=UPI0031FD3FF7